MGELDEWVTESCRLPTQWDICPYVRSPNGANLDPYAVSGATKTPALRLFSTNTDANLLDLDSDHLPLGASARTNLTPDSRKPYAKADANSTPSLHQNYANTNGYLTPSLRQPLLNIAEKVDPDYASLRASARRKGQRVEEASKSAQLHGGQVDEDQILDQI